MKRKIKWVLLILAVICLLLVLLAAGWRFFLYPALHGSQGEGEMEVILQIASESEDIDFDEDTGILYVNNEVVVFLDSNASQQQVQAFLDSQQAQVDDFMADLHIYRLVYSSKMTFGELESLVEQLKSNAIVEDAYPNPVMLSNTDEIEADTVEEKEPFYPDDPWGGSWFKKETWDVEVPRGENWSVEAIDAPGAWGYLDQISKVKVGLIDTMPDQTHEDLPRFHSSILTIDPETNEVQVNKYNVEKDLHGTHVAGIMVAGWDDGKGVSGIMANKGELYYSLAYMDNHTGTVGNACSTAYGYMQCIKVLLDQDVQVINISRNTSRLVGFAASHGNQKAIQYLTLQADLAEKTLLAMVEQRQAEGRPDFLICMSAGNSNHITYYPSENAAYGYLEDPAPGQTSGEKGGSLAKYNHFLNLIDAPEIKDRILVVGAIGIDQEASTTERTRYEYGYFSNVGDRVDLVAPGMSVYSTVPGGYKAEDGTSMSAPCASGAAGLVFGCNPDLTGPQVKRILMESTTGRYYYEGGYSGLLNVKNAVQLALETVGQQAEKVLDKRTESSLDLCFVVDTTNSMRDDIENAKENMEKILAQLQEKSQDYRVALIDYRDFADRSGDDDDYPAKVQQYFTSRDSIINSAIQDLDLGYGGDDNETVYSGLMAAVDLDWRDSAKKVIIILGDAPPLDPEPKTGYTYDDVLRALNSAGIGIDYTESDERATGTLQDGLITVYAIGTDASAEASDFFEDLSDSTGGSYVNVGDASEVGDAIADSIDQIEVDTRTTVYVDFGSDMADTLVDLYEGDTYLFTAETGPDGQVVLENMEPAAYRWKSNGIAAGGSFEVQEGSRDVSVRRTGSYWFAPALQLWRQHTLLICVMAAAYLAVCVAVPVSLKKVRVRFQERRLAAVSLGKGREKAPAPGGRRIWDPGPRPGADTVCPRCGSPIAKGARFCGRCGCQLPQTPPKPTGVYCCNCGNLCGENETYCSKCGAKIEKD